MSTPTPPSSPDSTPNPWPRDPNRPRTRLDDMEDRVAALEAEVALLRKVAATAGQLPPPEIAARPVAPAPVAPVTPAIPPAPIAPPTLPPARPAPITHLPEETPANVETFLANRAEPQAATDPSIFETDTAPSFKPLAAPPAMPPARPYTPVESAEPPPVSAPSRTPAPASSWNFESLIGTRGLPILGALAVVISVAMFLVYAAQQGWLTVPNWARMCGGIAFGAALVGVGEWLRRRINPWAAVGLFSAGIGCAYLSIYAGFAFFSPPVLNNVAAFALLALISIAGIGLALRANLAAVAVLSMIFAFLAPILIGSRDPSLWVMPIYLVVLLATGMWMNVYIGRGFIWPGRVAWWGTAILGTFWAISIRDQGMLATTITLAFVAIVWGIVQASLVLISRRDPSRPGQLGALSSFGIASWSSAIGVIALDTVNLPRFMAPAGAGAGAATLAMVVLGNFRPMSEKPRTFGDTLCISYWAQAAALLIVTVLLLTQGNNPVGVIIWMVMGVAAVWAGRRIALTSFVVYGIVLLAIGSVRLVGYDSWASALFASPIAAAPGLMLTSWTALCAIVAAAWLAAAGLLRTTEPLPTENGWPVTRPLPLTLVATGFLLASTAHINTTATAFGWVALLIAVTLGSLALIARGIWLHVASAIAIGAGCVAWMAAYLVDGVPVARFDSTTAAWLPLTHPRFVLALALAAVAVAWSIIFPRVRHLLATAPRAVALGLVLGFTGILFFTASSMEVGRILGWAGANTALQSGGVSTWWVLLGAAAMFYWTRKHLDVALYPGLALLALGTLRLVIIDSSSNGINSPALTLTDGIHLSAWTALSAITASAWFIAAFWLRDRSEPFPAAALWPVARPLTPTIIATSLLLGSIAHADATAAAFGWVALLVALATGSVALLVPRIWLHIGAATALLLALGAWCLAYLAPSWLRNSGGTVPSTAPPLLDPALLLALGVSFGLFAWVWTLRRVRHTTANEPFDGGRLVGWTLGGLVFWIATSFEVARVTRSFVSETTSQSAAVSIWWAILAVGLIIAGFMRVIPALRHVGLALLGIASLKVVIYDMANVSTPWRIASFMILGLLMLAVAAGYAWVAKRAASKPS